MGDVNVSEFRDAPYPLAQWLKANIPEIEDVGAKMNLATATRDGYTLSVSLINYGFLERNSVEKLLAAGYIIYTAKRIALIRSAPLGLSISSRKARGLARGK